MKFREHRGQLSDSMATQVELKTKEEFYKHLNKIWNVYGVQVDEVKFYYVGFDERISQETYNVSIYFEVDGWCCIGMSDSDKFEEE